MPEAALENLYLLIFLSMSKFFHRQPFLGIEDKIKFYQGFKNS